MSVGLRQYMADNLFDGVTMDLSALLDEIVENVTEWDAIESARLVAGIREALAPHINAMTKFPSRNYCLACSYPYPCPTVRILRPLVAEGEA